MGMRTEGKILDPIANNAPRVGTWSLVLAPGRGTPAAGGDEMRPPLPGRYGRGVGLHVAVELRSTGLFAA